MKVVFFFFFFFFFSPLLFDVFFSSFLLGLVTRDMKLMDKDMLAILGGQEREKSEEIPKKADEGENNNEGKTKKGKGKGEEGEKMSKETRRMKNKKNKEINMTKEEVSLLCFFPTPELINISFLPFSRSLNSWVVFFITLSVS